MSKPTKSELQLLEAQGFAKAVLDTAVDAIITINHLGIVESFNFAAEKIFQYSGTEVIGHNIKMLMPEPFQREHDSYLDNYMQTSKAKIIGIGRDVVGLRKNGSMFPLHLSVSEVFHQTERKFVGIIRDLTEQKKFEREAAEARDQLAHMDRVNMLSEMATGIAHEINQPLTAISMYAQTALRLLESQNPKMDLLISSLEKLSVQSHRAGSVIERMQQMVRHEDSERQIVSCNDLIEGVRNLAEIEAQLRNIEIEFTPNVKQCLLLTDSIQIQQVALNLLRNGMQAMDSIACKNGNKISINIEALNEQVKFSIIDQGTGITPEVDKILYKPFSSTKKQSMGIGLSLCKSIINSHGGQIGYNNNMRGGATFYFTLPLYLQNDEE